MITNNNHYHLSPWVSSCGECNGEEQASMICCSTSILNTLDTELTGWSVLYSHCSMLFWEREIKSSEE